jgi:hypothetical protein
MAYVDAKNTEFTKELTTLINKHSQENDSNTPDFVLAAYMMNCLNAFNAAIKHRAELAGGSIVSYETARPLEAKEISRELFVTGRHRPDIEEKIPGMLALRKQGWTYRRIAMSYHMHTSYVGLLIRKHKDDPRYRTQQQIDI